jgi:peroxiredoxin Q/BCP
LSHAASLLWLHGVTPLLKPGNPAPQFSLQTSNGSMLRSTDYVGKKPVVIFFYPKNDTLACTIESCAFRDSYQDFVAAGAEVIGISADPVTSHLRFREKHSLPFILASDADRRVAHAYGVAEGPFGLAGRATFVIDRQGIVRDGFSSRLRVKRHVSRALELVRELARASG